MHSVKFVAVILSTLILASCSTLSKEECHLGDWNGIGFADGSSGRGGNRIEAHRKACAEHGISPNLDAYLAGRERGLGHYCAPSNGYQEGLRDDAYEGVCRGRDEEAFLAAYNAGLAVHDVRSKIFSLEYRVGKKREEVGKVEDALDVARSRKITSAEDGEAVRNELLTLGAQLERLNGEKRVMEKELELLENELTRLLERHRNGLYS
ncbi:DUF2799 domain-containing protein [Nisaea acidiphila]|uniref:DUF2799 domain-containing protein n=1 Tax=Nisaea acidiphila TaxID=1862145 RepID=A0A9J7AXL0_9PROT|nr:DUF2799 domain-containing protein [Nisaea acidiphila]UUX51169.1 DUF2799 domain-containing protein [Nisaea acidiphila]